MSAMGLSLISCAAVVSFDDYGASRVPPRAVTVRVSTLDALPMVDALVVFHDSDGAPLDVRRTRSDGSATSPSPAKQVTVVLVSEGDFPSLTMTTVVGIEGGDEVAVTASAALAPESPLTRITVSLPTLRDAYQYDLMTTRSTVQGGNPDAIPLDIFADDLDRESTFALVARARASYGDRFIADPHVRLVKGQPLFLATTGPWLDPVRIPISVLRTPQDRALEAAGALLDGVAISVLVGERAVWTANVDPSSKVGEIPSGIGGDVIVTGSASSTSPDSVLSPQHAVMSSWLVQKRGLPNNAYSIDLATRPHVSAAVDVTDPKRPVVTWSALHDGIVGTSARVAISPEPSIVQSVSWRFIVPPDRREARAPQLPVELEHLLPKTWTAARHYASVDVEVSDGDAIRDLAAYRRFSAASFGQTIPARGQLRQSSFHAEF